MPLTSNNQFHQSLMRYEELKFVAAGCALVDDLEVFHERPGGVFTHTPFTANGADAPVKVPKTLVAILADILVAKQIAHDPRFVLATRGATLGTGAFVPGEVGLEIFQLFLFPALFACRPSSVPSGRIIGAHPDLFALDGFRVPTAPGAISSRWRLGHSCSSHWYAQCELTRSCHQRRPQISQSPAWNSPPSIGRGPKWSITANCHSE